MTNVLFLPRGFALTKKKDKESDQQFISLNFQEWDRLGNLAVEKIGPFLEGAVDGSGDDEDQSFVLSSVRGGVGKAEYAAKFCKKLVLGRYQGAKTISVRLFHGLNPCKTGVTLNHGEYSCIESCFSKSREAVTTAETYRSLLVDAVNDAKMKVCDGCRDSLPSQRDHVCLDPEDAGFAVRVKEVNPDVSFADFTECLAHRMRVDEFECEDAFKWFHHHRRYMKPSVLVEMVGSEAVAKTQQQWEEVKQPALKRQKTMVTGGTAMPKKRAVVEVHGNVEAEDGDEVLTVCM